MKKQEIVKAAEEKLSSYEISDEQMEMVTGGIVDTDTFGGKKSDNPNPVQGNDQTPIFPNFSGGGAIFNGSVMG